MCHFAVAGLVHKPTVLPAGYLFVAEVETSLPYRESFVANELTCHAVLTDHLITLFVSVSFL